MVMDKLNSKLTQLIDRDKYIGLLQGAVQHESITGNEANFVGYLSKKMTDLNLNPEQEDFLPNRPNIWGRRKGNGIGKTLQFIGHTDTVHVNGWRENWAGDPRENPFGAAIIDGQIWGRGSGDLKAGICTSLAALDLLDVAGISLNGDVQYAFIGDEESGQERTGVSAGIKQYVKRFESGKTSKPDFAIYTEPTQLNIFTAQMGFFILDIKIIGKSAYFGVPESGIDALKASHKALAAIWQHSEHLSQAHNHDLVGNAFVLVTAISGGGYIAVPGECSISLIRKLVPGESLNDAATQLEQVIRASNKLEGVEFEFSYPAGRDHKLGGSPAEIDNGLPEIKQLSNAIELALPEHGKIKGAPFWSESPFVINQMNCPTVYCAPGDITNCHTFEERVDIEEYLAAIVAFASFMATYCGISE
ncbi:MAG: M20/M25/M40 family metallo-hydrolase [Rhizobiales bacterium]|nr:M20/M25/M40 family metallo-hydrolase [Hyphomicrobiales bacterium]